MKKQYSRALIAATAVGGLLFSGLAVAPSWAVPSYPTAAEVEAAKQNVSDKKAMIERIEQIISDLAAEADELGRLAQIKGETFNQVFFFFDMLTT